MYVTFQGTLPADTVSWHSLCLAKGLVMLWLKLCLTRAVLTSKTFADFLLRTLRLLIAEA